MSATLTPAHVLWMEALVERDRAQALAMWAAGYTCLPSRDRIYWWWGNPERSLAHGLEIIVRPAWCAARLRVARSRQSAS